MKFSILAGLALSICSTCVYAQQALVGKYSGSVSSPRSSGGTNQIGISVDITGAESGALKGTITSGGRDCGGNFPIEGTYEGNNLKFKMTGSGKVAGCGDLAFEGVAEGDKVVGKIVWQGSPRDIRFSK